MDSFSIWIGRSGSNHLIGRDAVHRPSSLEAGMSLPHVPEWQDDALCAQTDPDAFFPEKGGSTRLAKQVCVTCEVRAECLQYAMDHDERFGIWGGLSERERRKLKKLKKSGGGITE